MTSETLAVMYPDIQKAAERLKGVAHHTPVMTSRQANRAVDAELFFKCENFQRAGAFKFRGAYNALQSLNDAQKRKGVVAFSSGNHAQAMALAGQILDIPVTIVMPHDAPELKRAATREYGAKIIGYDRYKEDREQIARQLSEGEGLAIIPPFDHPAVIAGQGTAAKELIEEIGRFDYLFVCVGGGGLLAGSAIATRHLLPDCKVIGVEPEAGNDVQQSFAQGRRITIPVPQTIADGAQTTCVGQLTFPIIQALVDEIVTVSDAELLKQMQFFAERMKIVVEPTGCLGAAAIANHKINVAGKRVGVILSGGNTSFIKCVPN